MKKIIPTALCFLFGISILQAQTTESESAKRVKGEAFSRNSVYLGILGPTIPLSLNYDRIWTKSGVINISTKFGGFYSRFKKYNNLTIANGSFDVNMLVGRSKHVFEMGIGWTGHYGSYYSDKDSTTKHYGVPTSNFSMAYRFQKPDGGVFFKLGFTASTILLFAASDLTELAIGNTIIFAMDQVTGRKPTFTLLSVGIGYSF